MQYLIKYVFKNGPYSIAVNEKLTEADVRGNDGTQTLNDRIVKFICSYPHPVASVSVEIINPTSNILKSL